MTNYTRKSPPPNPPINCPKCNADKAFRAKICPKCKTVYLGEEIKEEGVTGVCPRCNPEIRRNPLKEVVDEPQDFEQNGEDSTKVPIRKHPVLPA